MRRTRIDDRIDDKLSALQLEERRKIGNDDPIHAISYESTFKSPFQDEEKKSMPIYEYRCKGCQNDFEALVWTSREEKSVECPKCNTREVERILSPFARTAGTGGGTGLSKSACGPSSSKFS